MDSNRIETLGEDDGRVTKKTDFFSVEVVDSEDEELKVIDKKDQKEGPKSKGKMKKLLNKKNKFLTDFDKTLENFNKTIEVMNN